MAPTTQPPPSPSQRKPRSWVPVRDCGRCGECDDVFHLTMVGKTWLCRTCHGKLRFSDGRNPRLARRSPSEPTPAPLEANPSPQSGTAQAEPGDGFGTNRSLVGGRRGPPRRPSKVHDDLAKIDAVVRWICVAGRVVAYLVLMALTARHPIVEHVLFGFFLADIAAWAVLAWIDARFHGYAVTTEAVLYSVLFFVLYASGSLDLPTDPAEQYLAAGTAGLTLLGHVAKFWRKLTC